jgi:hypothetical protein
MESNAVFNRLLSLMDIPPVPVLLFPEGSGEFSASAKIDASGSV